MRAVWRQSGGRFPLLPVVRRAEADEGRRVLPSSPADRLRTRAAGFPLPRGTPGGAARTFQRLVGGWGVGPRRGRRLTGSERGDPSRRLPPRSDRAQPGARTARRHSSSQRPLKAPYFRQIRMKVVFGSTDPPGVLTFFASWKSAATILARVFPTRTRGASRGSAKTAMPVA